MIVSCNCVEYTAVVLILPRLNWITNDQYKTRCENYSDDFSGNNNSSEYKDKINVVEDKCHDFLSTALSEIKIINIRINKYNI